MSWGQAHVGNGIGFGQGSDNDGGIDWGAIYPDSWSGDTALEVGFSFGNALLFDGVNDYVSIGSAVRCAGGF